jgi:probable F420-dependent oxidoreductase
MSIHAGVGLATYPFESTDGYWEWVHYCDENGVDSIWQTDRLVSSEPVLESMVTMAALAGGTKKVKFGMNVVSMGIRDPLVIAKQCATIDVLSKGRMLPAFGIGSIRSRDYAATGRPTKRRGVRTNEALEIVGRLWQGERLTYKGEFFEYEDAVISPLPVQKRFPLWIGGSSKAAIERTARYGTGWQAAAETPDEAGIVVEKIKAATAKAGRAIDFDHYGTGIAFRFGGWDDPGVERAAKGYKAITGRDPAQGLAIGGADEILAKIEAFVANGIFKFILRPIAYGDDEMMAQTRRLVEEVMPAVERMND